MGRSEMNESPGLDMVTQLLKQLLSGKYRPLPVPAEAERDELQFYDLLNRLAAQKSDLIEHYNEDLKQSETRLRNIIESTPVGICITDEHGYFEYMNPTYCRLYGYTPDEILGKHFTLVVPERLRDELSHLHAEFMGRRYELRGEWEVVKKDGTPMSILADAAYIIDIDDRPKKVTFVLDISERKRSEKLLAETVERLNEEIRRREELEIVKNRVERMIRHDLRNPLNGILAAAELLMTEALGSEQQELCMVIRESARKLDSMLSSSMDLIRMEEGTYELRPEPINLVDVLREVRREVEPLAANLGVRVSYALDGTPLSWKHQLPIEGERLYLADAFSNLLRNAIEASGRGDEVAVTIVGSDNYEVSIHNPGVVPEEIRDTFFDRYTTSGKKNGTGLGTYVAALITRIHHGEIGFSSSRDEGTIVWVRLPTRQPTE
ncbi:MAG: two-component system sensor histidine kinase NtrB [Spirochaetota bacterium]